MTTPIHRLITANNQSVADISATAIKPSTAIRRGTVSRIGNGQISVEGAYTGDNDAVIDVEIVSGGANRITEPGYIGVGTGSMDSVALLPGATPQLWNVTLIDLGIDTESAQTDIEGVQVIAKAAGTIGNNITIDVDQSGIIFTDSDFSLIEDVSSGTTTTTGSAYDWATVVGVGDGVPSGAKRFAFEGDSTIYRQWKVYTDGRFEYRYLPAFKRDYSAGTKIKFVTGSRDVTVSDGATTELYTGVVTLSDFLSQVRDTPSALIDVTGVIPTDNTSAAATLDLRTRTDARVEETTGSGGFATGFTDISVGANAYTEVIEANCYAAGSRDGASLGREKWQLRGSISGDLGTLVSGDSFTEFENRFSFRIPKKLPTGYELGETRGGIGFSFQPTGREENQVIPSVGSRPLFLGSEARDKQVTFRYERRPGDELDWTKQIASGYISEKCLGVEIDNVNISPEYLSRLQLVMSARETFIRNATRFGATAAGGNTITLYYIEFDLAAGSGGTSGGSVKSRISTGFLDQATADAALLNVDGEVVTIDYNLVPGYYDNMAIDGINYRVEINQPGTALPEDPNGTVEDRIPFAQGLSIFSQRPLITPTTATISSGVVVSEVVSNDAFGSPVVSSNSDGYVADTTDIDFYSKAIRIMVSALNDVFEDATARAQWDALWAEVSAELIANLDAANNQLTDGEPHDEYLIRWYAAADNIRLTAGILPKSSANAGGSDTCWRDDPSASHWWVHSEGIYLPAFTGRTYVSAVLGQDEIPETTKEFAMAILVDGNLKEGDEVTITIGDAGWENTYQPGDQLFLTTVAGTPLALAGGVDGTDTLTWSVAGDTKTADYLQTDTPSVYDNGQIQFKIQNGGTPFEPGDAFTLAVEDTAFRWRKDAGTYSAALPVGSTAIADGLTVEFQEGVTPSFVAGDTASFNILQPHNVQNASVPSESKYSWETATDITLVCIGDVDTIAVAMHSLSLNLAVDDGTTIHTLAIKPGVSIVNIPLVINPTITISATEGGSIGWIWAGVPSKLTGHSGDHKSVRQWQTISGSGLNSTSVLRGKGRSWTVGFNLECLLSDIELLSQAIDHHQQNGGQPCIWMPHIERDFADLVRLPDSLDVESHSQFSDISEIASTTLELSAYYE